MTGKLRDFTVSDHTAEDPTRQPHEKETALHHEGDATHLLVTSFKEVVFAKLLHHSEFEVERLNVLNAKGRRGTADSLGEVVDGSELTIIGVMGRLPLGTMSIGSPRNSNSPADIVK